MQMQGMRFDPRNDNGQYPHGMNPYGAMGGLQQPGMVMQHGMQGMGGFPPNQMHPMDPMDGARGAPMSSMGLNQMVNM